MKRFAWQKLQGIIFEGTEEKMETNQESRILGEEKISKLLLKFSLPCVMGLLISALYNIVDQIFIGNSELGFLGNAATGVSFPVICIANAFAWCVGDGAASYLSICSGRKDTERAHKCVGSGIVATTLISIVLMVVCEVFATPLMSIFGASDQTLGMAVEYFRIVVAFFPFYLLLNVMNSMIRADGSPSYAMAAMLIGAITNIILDPIFIFGLGLGVKGAALATVLSQGVGALWILRFLTGKKTSLRLRVVNMKLDPKVFLPCLGLGISTFVMLSTESLLSISFTTSLSRYGGDLAVGAMTIITSVSQLVTMPMQGICQGGQPIISFNYGAGNKERVKKAFFLQFAICAIYATLFWLISMSMPQLFAGIFTNDVALVEYGAWALRIYMAGIFAFGLQLSCQQSFMALGQAKISLVLACLRKIVLLIPLIFILPMFFENKVFGVFLAEPVCDITAALVTTITFFSQFNKILNRNTEKKDA